MPSLKANRIKEAFYEAASITGRRARATYHVVGLDRSTPSLTLKNVLSVEGLPDLGDLFPGESAGSEFEGLRCRRIWVGQSNGVAAWVYADYDTNPGALVGYFTINRTSRSYSEMTARLPDGTPIITSPMTFVDGETGRTIPGQITPIVVRKPLKVLEITGVGLGHLPSEVEDAHLTVNNAPWQGLPAGYWLCTVQQSVESHDASQRRIYIAFESKATEPWLVDAWTTEPTGGKCIGNIAGLPTTYLPGLQYPASGGGAVTVGYYEGRDFDDVFGQYLIA